MRCHHKSRNKRQVCNLLFSLFLLQEVSFTDDLKSSVTEQVVFAQSHMYGILRTPYRTLIHAHVIFLCTCVAQALCNSHSLITRVLPKNEIYPHLHGHMFVSAHDTVTLHIRSHFHFFLNIHCVLQEVWYRQSG